MTKCTTLLLAGTLFSLLACQSAKPDLIREPFAEKQAQIAQTVQAIFEAAQAKNFERLEAFHLDGPKFTKFDDSEPKDRKNAEEGKKSEREIFSALEEFTFKISEMKADVFDRVGIATFMIEYAAKVQGTPVAGKVRSTLVFVEDAGQWKITHEHFSTY
ncbi:MAG: nuclear transport factor 2 family protein [Saprospiraceae bacterium]|nr:nuclear transport factor 2 family protein [Saprospiraceae bacterium]